MNSLLDNQHPHRWIPEKPDFITLVCDSTKSTLLSCRETIVIGHLGNIYCLKNRIHRFYYNPK